MQSVITPSESIDSSTLELRLKCNSEGKTIIAHQYQTHPLKISRPFRLDRDRDCRAYLYLRNNSPGLFAQDRLNISLNLKQNTQTYLTEQSATKVHPMTSGATAEVNYQWNIEEGAMVEFVSEPLILYRDSALKQKTQIELHPTASLFWSDIVLPGRLARGEFYQFCFYHNCLEVYSDRGELWLKEQTYLKGNNNKFGNSKLFASLPVLGTAIAIMPDVELSLLEQAINNLNQDSFNKLITATSVLPHNKGILIKVLASQVQTIKSYYSCVIDTIRKLNHQPLLPTIPK